MFSNKKVVVVMPMPPLLTVTLRADSTVQGSHPAMALLLTAVAILTVILILLMLSILITVSDRVLVVLLLLTVMRLLRQILTVTAGMMTPARLTPVRATRIMLISDAMSISRKS